MSRYHPYTTGSQFDHEFNIYNPTYSRNRVEAFQSANCKAIPDAKGRKLATDDWCNNNCNHIPRFCPPDLCSCDGSSGGKTPEPQPVVTTAPPRPITTAPPRPITTAPPRPVTTAPPRPVTTAPVTTAPPRPVTTAPPRPVTTAPPRPVTTAPPRPVTTAPPRPVTTAPVTTAPVTTAPPRPVTTAPVTTPSGNIPGKQIGGINLESGYATTTIEGILGMHDLACGQKGGSAKQYGVNALGAVPQNLYKKIGGVNYNPNGVFSCSGHGAPLVDENGKQVCYKLTGPGPNPTEITIYPADTCNGGCVADFKEGSDCSSIASCMDIKPQNYEAQRKKSIRCSPVIMAQDNKLLSQSEIQKRLTDAYQTGEVINCPQDKDVSIPGYASKPSTGWCDWCGGDNMHFDIQMSDGGSPFTSGQVVKYKRIDCPGSSQPDVPDDKGGGGDQPIGKSCGGGKGRCLSGGTKCPSGNPIPGSDGSIWNPDCEYNLCCPAGPTTAPGGPTTAPGGPTTAPGGPTTAPSEPTTAPTGKLCSGSGYDIKWANGTPPKELTWDQVAQVWKEANPEDANLACQAAGLSAGESVSNTENTVVVAQKGHRKDPATQQYPYGLWQALPNWYAKTGLYSKSIGANTLPSTWADEMKTDPCKQAYITNRIRKEHCVNEGNKLNDPYLCAPPSGPIRSAPGFCNSGWTGDCPGSVGGQTPNGPVECAYYRKNPNYKKFCNNSKTCGNQCKLHPPCN